MESDPGRPRPGRTGDSQPRAYDPPVETAVTAVDPGGGQSAQTPPRPALSVVVPVYDGATTIVENVDAIRRAVEPGIDGEVELIVVSDGSVDDTAERLLAAREESRARVIHYDRNLGKGYAVRAGALASTGEWVAFIDADLDLDPASIPRYLEVARHEQLDIALGSKRHPESVVHYPRARRIASWCYQLLNRVLFQLDVRDTQVGLKVISRDVVDNVMPLLLVKQFAFDLELLAVAHALGYRRVRELPVTLDYRFTGSGVRSAAVARALVDTAAIFYRLRILRTYQRKQALLGPSGVARRPETLPRVTLVGSDEETAQRLDYPAVDVLPGDPAGAARAASSEVVALLAPGASPAGNWLTAAAPFFVRPEVAAVVVPEMAPHHGPPRRVAAAAILESRLGAGSPRIRYSPGNVRVVVDHPAPSVVVRRAAYLEALDEHVPRERLVAWLAARGRETVYTPDTMIVDTPAPLFGPHLRSVAGYARSRGVAARLTRGRSFTLARLLVLVPFAAALAGVVLIAAGGTARTVGIVLVLVYLAAVLLGAATGAFRFRSLRVGLLAAPAFVATHAVYVAAFLAGVATGR
jgi:glycosyltransferase involved in cell wall biosynthesis